MKDVDSNLAPSPTDGAPSIAETEYGMLETDPAPASDGNEGTGELVVEDVFGSEENARAATRLITRFVASWERHKHDREPERWLADELRQFPDIWTSEAEAASTAREIVVAVERANASNESLRAHLNAGKSKSSWLAGEIERGAAAAGTTHVGDYAAGVEAALQDANAGMLGTVRTQGGAISMVPSLDGFIAEQHHVDRFNLDAATKGSVLRAKVLSPELGQPWKMPCFTEFRECQH